jgi:ribosome-binding factor A
MLSQKKQIVSRRKLQVASKLLHILGRALRTKAADERLLSVTLTAVDISPDLKNATVFYSMSGDESKRAEIDKALSGATGFFRKQVAASIELRYTPKLTFKFDEFSQSSIKMSRFLDSISLDDDLSSVNTSAAGASLVEHDAHADEENAS